jgi:6-pyruvoyltetrahydropterin/6-carboxytetrahydropterin synthase
MRTPKAGNLLITRQVEFAAAHRLYKESLSDEDNFACFGKCANPYGHGHNYVLEVTVEGTPDPKTELIVHYQTLKGILEEYIIKPADHRHLNHDVAFMKGRMPTSENIAVAVWETLSDAFKGKTWTLYKVKLASTARSWVEYYGPAT